MRESDLQSSRDSNYTVQKGYQYRMYLYRIYATVDIKLGRYQPASLVVRESRTARSGAVSSKDKRI